MDGRLMATKTKGEVAFSMVDLLERGYPGELLPADLERAHAAAHWYVANASHSPEARDRVYQVWIGSQYRPAFDARAMRSDSGTARSAPETEGK